MKTIVSVLLIMVLLFCMCACSQTSQLTWEEQYGLGIYYLSENKCAEAIDAFTEAISIDGRRPESYIARGKAHLFSGDAEENFSAAQADYEEAIDLDSTVADAWLGLADVYIRQGNWEQASEVLQQGLEATGADQEITDKLSEIASHQVFDSAGNLRIWIIDDGGGIESYFFYTYDKQGSKTSITGFDSEGNRTSHIECDYDQNGNPLVEEGVYHQSDGDLGVKENEYDASGNLIKSTTHVDDSLDSAVESYHIFTYDTEGNLIRCEYFYGNGKLFWTITYTYDDGVKIKEERCGDSTSLYYCKFFEYDDTGRLLRMNCYDSCEELGGELSYYIVYSYDTEGNCKYSEWFNALNNLKKVEFYDSTGKKVEYFP